MSWRFLLRLLLVLAVLAGGVMAGTYFLRPVALVTPVRRDTARDAVAGTLTVQAVPFPLVADVGGRIAESHLELGRTVTMGEVVVKLDDSSVKLEIEDRGKGMPPAHERPQGLGLVAMRERAELIGGQLSFSETPGGGVLVRLEVSMMSSSNVA